eukprot:TRINITY_DN527_c0_g1_i5.p1 TRINITY_DN527_c0_g1~~TRINITY_DN527_c0_g1_i5.p1  ORF type:complete len:559 (+),score=173.76 TRINITY_DN527_c0_g1_i5:103-1779(+)
MDTSSADAAGTPSQHNSPRLLPTPEEEVQQSAFEFTNKLISAAKSQLIHQNVINAGRGNPNFLLTTVRDAFAQLLLFATFVAGEEQEGLPRGLRVRPEKLGIAAKLQTWLKQHSRSKGAAFLFNAINFINENGDMDADDIVFELIDAAEGDYYPTPPRMLPITEGIVLQYLNQVLFRGYPPLGHFSLFATEGATAAMIYIFNTLKNNYILRPGDRVAIIAPIFTPYLEIPGLAEYELVPVILQTKEELGWQLDPADIAKLADTSIKALFEVNPANPSSTSMSKQCVKEIATVIRERNPNLIVVCDTVYANFVDDYNSLLHEIPQNVVGVYSFSKYFGVTGWRLGVVMVHENTILDKLVAQLPECERKALTARYKIITHKSQHVSFISRLEYDSRALALAHTAGLSGPQQAIMCLFALHELLDKDGIYRTAILNILRERWTNLFGGLGLPAPDSPLLTRYYALINLKNLADTKHGKEFSEWFSSNCTTYQFLKTLAETYFTVCLPGKKFYGPEWSIRISIANVNADDCARVGRNVALLLDFYHEAFKQATATVANPSTQ